MTGLTVGNWVLGAELGRGPHGAVFRATSTDGRTAAVKLFTHPAALAADFLARFPAEMLALQRLNHPNVAKFFDSGVHAGTAYSASELVDGPDLAARLKAAGDSGLNWKDDLVRLAVQIARALKHGHHRSILHRALTPGNVLTSANGTVKLADFGVAKVLNLPPLAAPADGNPWCPAAFTAPECLTGKPVTRRSDLYSLGCVLYAAATGRPPFLAATPAEFLHKHCYTLPDRPQQFAPKLPTELDDLIVALLAKDPNRRPASAAAVLESLDQIRGKLERKGIAVGWPSDAGDTHPTPALGALLDAEDVEEPARPLMSRPVVVVPLFLLVAGLLVWGLFLRSGPDPDALFAAAQPLLESSNPADWDRAWDEYLEPLSRAAPEKYAGEIAAARQKIADRRELRRQIDAGTKLRFRTEAERMYVRGLRLAQAGDLAAARQTWLAVGTAFPHTGDEARWVDLAAAGVAALAAIPPPTSESTARPGVEGAVARAKAMADARDPAAPSAFDALEYLYRDDPAALAAIRRARP